MLQAPNGGCYIVGSTNSNDYDCTGDHGDSSGTFDVYIARLDRNGNLLWHHDFGGIYNESGEYACSDGKNGVLITGFASSNDGDVTHLINVGGANIWVIDVDSSGNIVWNNCYGGGGDEGGHSICKANDGSIWIAGISTVKGGEVDTAYGEGDAWFVHADSVGNYLSAKVLGSDKQDCANMIYPLSDGTIIAGGYYNDSGGTFANNYYIGNDAFIVVFAPWTTEINKINLTKNKINIYPNPCKENISIEPIINDNYSILITNIIGELVYENTISEKIELSVIDWNKGIYFITIINNNGYKEVQKIIIN